MQMMSASNVDALKHDAEQAHMEYSRAFEASAAAERALGQAAAKRSSIVLRLEESKLALSAGRRTAISACIEGAGFGEAAAKVLALDNEVDLLDAALKSYHSGQYADAKRAAMAVQVRALELQVLSEKARRELWVAELQINLAPLALANGSLEVKMDNGVIRGMTELIDRLTRAADSAREDLHRHDMETHELRSSL